MYRPLLSGGSIQIDRQHYDITNDDLIEIDSRKLEHEISLLHKKLDCAFKEFVRKRNKLLQKEELLAAAKRITQIYKGVAICDNFESNQSGNERYNVIGAARSSQKRSASVYRNAHNKTTWGIHLYDYAKPLYGLGREKWLGADYEDLEKCKKIALDWVATGKIITIVR